MTLKRAMGVALWGHVRIGEKLLALGIPGTFMNMSGEGVYTRHTTSLGDSFLMFIADPPEAGEAAS